MNAELLESLVNESLQRIYNNPDFNRRRCHEIARFLKTDLEKHLSDVRIVDGKVIYNAEYAYLRFVEKYFPELVGEADITPKKREVCYLHSWLEVGDLMVDYHIVLKLSPDIVLENFLMVESRQSLGKIARYEPPGKLLGRSWLYIPPLYFTRLRLPSDNFI
jgi:hypothetical protein